MQSLKYCILVILTLPLSSLAFFWTGHYDLDDKPISSCYDKHACGLHTETTWLEDTELVKFTDLLTQYGTYNNIVSYLT